MMPVLEMRLGLECDYQRIANIIEDIFQNEKASLDDSIIILMTMVTEMVESTYQPSVWYAHLIGKLLYKFKEAKEMESVEGMSMQ